MFERFAAAMGRPELATEDPRYADPPSRLAHLGALWDDIRAWAATFPDPAAIETVFTAHGIAMGVLRTVRDVAGSSWAREREAIVTVSDRGDGTIALPNAPWTFSRDAAGVRGVPKYRGEDNRTVLAERLGLGDAELDQLEQAGVLTSRVPAR